jgi:mannose-6-phosphate isomerase-like protein (cupin superfamily)
MRTALQCLFLIMPLLIPLSLAAQVMSPTVPPPLTAPSNDRDDARTILARYADAWRGAEEMKGLDDDVVLGFDIRGEGGGRFHVTLPASGRARLADGPPPASHLVVYETDIEFLRRLDRGELNALTAMGQARGDDPIPLVPRFSPDFRWTAESRAFAQPLMFHFWNRTWPEVIRFGEGTTRRIHGGDLGILYYTTGLRAGFGQIRPGMRVNEDPTDQANPFPTLLIVTRGVATARLGGVEMILQEGQAMFIPAGMTHEAWATAEQYAEFIIIMFGPGA